jgi:aminoglycoside N3'-acetyltransferase
MDAFNIALGTEFEGGATFLHHTEETARVPYRFYKDFPGDVSFKDGRKSPKTYKMFVREIAETYEWDNKWDPVWEDFVNDGLVTQQVLNGANLFALPIKPTHDRFLKRLIADPCYCANKISR